jgi:hypothetical protein
LPEREKDDKFASHCSYEAFLGKGANTKRACAVAGGCGGPTAMRFDRHRARA